LDRRGRTGLVPRVAQVERLTGQASAAQDAVGVALLRLLVAVVAALAQRLQVAGVAELVAVAIVPLDVINHPSGHQLPQLGMHAAQRLGTQLRAPQPAPCRSVVKVMVFGQGIRQCKTPSRREPVGV
jgi:hypothetical protein